MFFYSVKLLGLKMRQLIQVVKITVWIRHSKSEAELVLSLSVYKQCCQQLRCYWHPCPALVPCSNPDRLHLTLQHGFNHQCSSEAP